MKKTTYNKLTRIISVVLCFCLVFCTFAISASGEVAEAEVWDGSLAASLTGAGTETEPYEIGNGSELAYAITSGVKGAYYKLTADIYLNDITKINWATGEVTEGYNANSWYANNTTFKGTLDGNGFTVYGLYYDENPSSMVSYPGYGSALIPKVATDDTVTLKNLGVDCAYIEVECAASAFVATSNGTVNVDSCYAGEKVYLNGGDAAAFVGYVGADRAATITNSYSLATLSGVTNKGLVGNVDMSDVTVNNCYNATGPIVSHNDESYSTYIKVSSSYETTKSAEGTGDARYSFTDVAVISAANMMGEDVLTNSFKMPKLNTNEAFVAKLGYPILKVFDKTVDDGSSDDNNDDNNGGGNTGIWDGSVATSLSGEGTPEKPYIISNGAELAYAIKSKGASNNFYKITNDIYLNDITKVNWSTGEYDNGYTINTWLDQNYSFAGTIDGNGKVIYGLYFNDNITSKMQHPWGCGLIPEVSAGNTLNISKLGIDNCFINYECGAAAFVGSVEDEAYVFIKQCYVGENVSISAADAGAFRGYSAAGCTTSIINSYSTAKSILGTVDSGLVGNVWGPLEIIRCYNANGPIMSETEVYEVDLFDCYQSEEGGNNYRVTTLDAYSMQGVDVFGDVYKMPYLNADGVFTVTKSYPVLSAFVKSQTEIEEQPEIEEENPIEIWDGSVANSLSGSGTETEPYEIGNGSELALAITSGGDNKFYKLTADIYLNDITKINWATGEVTEGYNANSWYANNTTFKGTLDGNGFTVYGLYYDENPSAMSSYAGYGSALVPKVAAGDTVTVKNLGVDNTYIEVECGASAFVASSNGTVNVDSCYAGENVYLNGGDAAAFVGYVGADRAATITNSYSLATLSGASNSGFVGNAGMSAVTISNSYNAKGALISYNRDSSYSTNIKVSNSYETIKSAEGTGDARYSFTDVTVISAENMQGEDVFTNSAKMPKLNSENIFVASEGYPLLNVFAKKNNLELFKYWDGSKSEPSEGNGTEENPYLIRYASEFAYMVSVGGNGKFYKLTADIYLNDISKINWSTGQSEEGYTPNGWYNSWDGCSAQFEGHIDGDGYVIYGMYYNDNNTDYDSFAPYSVGLIPAVASGAEVSIKNLGVDKAFIHTKHDASAFVGVANKDDTSGSNISFENCFAGHNVYLDGCNVAAFRAGSYSGSTSINNCYSFANLYPHQNGGYGFIGQWSYLNISSSFNGNGPIWSQSVKAEYAGVTIKNCYESQTVGFDDAAILISRDTIKGRTALTYMPDLNTGAFIPLYDDYPVLSAFLKLSVQKDGKKYYGNTYDEFSDYYTTYDGASYFWRYAHINVNDDGVMDICDLVQLGLQLKTGGGSFDIDSDEACTANDAAILRKALIGLGDYTEIPKNYSPSISGLSSEYKYVWGDEFNGQYLDSQNWSLIAKMPGSDDGVVNVLSDKSAVNVEDGKLRLTAYKDANGNYAVPSSVATQNTMNFKYGYVEIRAKLPLQHGVWTSFWTKSVADAQDRNSIATTDNKIMGEVDIIEVFDRNRVCANIIKWDEYNLYNWENWYPTTMGNAQYVTPPDDDEYHIYGYEWTKDKLKMYYDGELYAAFDITESWVNKGELDKGKDGWKFNYWDETGTDMSCFNDPHFLVFNNHLFYPGISGANASITENTEFSRADFLIDYCRVYQKSIDSELYVK